MPDDRQEEAALLQIMMLSRSCQGHASTSIMVNPEVDHVARSACALELHPVLFNMHDYTGCRNTPTRGCFVPTPGSKYWLTRGNETYQSAHVRKCLVQGKALCIVHATST